MAYTNKLDTDIITIRYVSEGLEYDSSAGTIELNAVTTYYTYIDALGFATNFTVLIISGASIIVDETYATIDTLLNP